MFPLVAFCNSAPPACGLVVSSLKIDLDGELWLPMMLLALACSLLLRRDPPGRCDVFLHECRLIGAGTAAKPAEEGKAPEAAVSDAASAAAMTTEAPAATSAPTTATPVAVRVCTTTPCSCLPSSCLFARPSRFLCLLRWRAEHLLCIHRTRDRMCPMQWAMLVSVPTCVCVCA